MQKHVLQRKTIGDASESALIKFVQPFKDILQYRKENPMISEIPFSSELKWQLSIHNQPNDTRKLLVVKGAPERILGMCSKIMINGKEQDLDEKWKSEFNQTYQNLGERGERVLGFAHTYLNVDDFPTGFDFDVDRMNLQQKPRVSDCV